MLARDNRRDQNPDRRLSPRRVCRLAGHIVVPGYPKLKCTVLNISPMGALIQLETAAILPPTFSLQIPEDLFSVECDLRHRNGNNAGVAFTSDRQGAMARYS